MFSCGRCLPSSQKQSLPLSVCVCRMAFIVWTSFNWVMFWPALAMVATSVWCFSKVIMSSGHRHQRISRLSLHQSYSSPGCSWGAWRIFPEAPQSETMVLLRDGCLMKLQESQRQGQDRSATRMLSFSWCTVWKPLSSCLHQAQTFIKLSIAKFWSFWAEDAFHFIKSQREVWKCFFFSKSGSKMANFVLCCGLFWAYDTFWWPQGDSSWGCGRISGAPSQFRTSPLSAVTIDIQAPIAWASLGTMTAYELGLQTSSMTTARLAKLDHHPQQPWSMATSRLSRSRRKQEARKSSCPAFWDALGQKKPVENPQNFEKDIGKTDWNVQHNGNECGQRSLEKIYRLWPDTQEMDVGTAVLEQTSNLWIWNRIWQLALLRTWGVFRTEDFVLRGRCSVGRRSEQSALDEFGLSSLSLSLSPVLPLRSQRH